jgi:hypothetical protein
MPPTQRETVDGVTPMTAYLSENYLENESLRPPIMKLMRNWEGNLPEDVAGPNVGVEKILIDIRALMKKVDAGEKEPVSRLVAAQFFEPYADFPSAGQASIRRQSARLPRDGSSYRPLRCSTNM